MTRNAYGQSYQAGFERTVRFLVSIGVQRDDALETAQAAWVRGWERVKQLRDEKLVTTWVNTIALNIYRSGLRQEIRMEPLPELQCGLKSDTDAIDADRVLKFSRPCDRILLEQQMCGATSEEIARSLGVTQTAIRIRLLRARRSARVRLERRAAQLRAWSGVPQRDAA
jgi:DNA-directed RNA polymerase specialized sigma24 family protein